MSATNIRVLKDRHHGETIYVVASGASVDPKHTPPEFWLDKIIVAVNEMWQHVPATYAIAHHHERLQEAIDAGQRVVTSAIDLGGPGWGQSHAFTGDYYIYAMTPYTQSTTPTIDTEALLQPTADGLVASACTTSEAIQFAAHLGARSIVCCGMDGAALDGQWSVTGYNLHSTGAAQTNPQHCRLTRSILLQTINAIRKKGVSVSSHDPFVGFDHEGHVYTPAQELSGRALIQALSTVNYQQVEETA